MSAPSPSASATRAQQRPSPLHTGLATVRTAWRLTPRMTRIVLTGEALAGFPDEEPGEILTLIWPAAGADSPVLPSDGWRYPPGTPEQHWRNYTIRDYDAGGPALTIDFVLHGDHGAASAWASRARPDDTVGFAGPRIHFYAEPDADWTLLCGDETAPPSIAATLERLPAGHRVLAFVEVADADERIELATPCDLDLTWLHRDGEPAGRSRRLPGGGGRRHVAGGSREALGRRRVAHRPRPARAPARRAGP